MSVSFNLLDPNMPANIAGSVYAGQQQRQQNELAKQQLLQSQQQLQQSQMQTEKTGMDIQKMRSDQAALQKMQQAFVANGKSPDLESNFNEMIQSGIPHFVDIGTKGLQKIQEQKQFASIMGGPSAANVAPATPVAPVAAPEVGANALAPAAPVAAAPVNALADQQSRINAAYQLGTAPALAWAKAQEERMKPIHGAAGGFVYDPITKTFVQAPEKTPVAAPTNLAKLQAEMAALPPGDPRRAQYEALIRKETTHAPGTTVTVSTEKKYGEAFGTKIADVDIGKMTTAEKAPQLAESANRIIDIVNKGDVFTGPAADIKLNIARALNVAGASNEEKIANTEALVAATGQSTLDSIKGAGLGTGQGFTDKDLKFLQGIAGGTIALTKTTLTNLATLQHRVAARSAEAWNTRVKEMPQEVIKGTGLSTTPIKIPPLASTSTGVASRPAGVGNNWTLERDAAGNTAWVSPDRKAFKEAK